MQPRTIIATARFTKPQIVATERTYARITGSDHKFAYPCRFDLWDEIGYEPEYRDTCTYKYKNKGEQEEHTSDSPWCPQQSPHDKTPWIRCNCEFYKLFQLTETTSLYSPLPKIPIFLWFQITHGGTESAKTFWGSTKRGTNTDICHTTLTTTGKEG